MTWLGKILTFVVMIAAVAWMYFTVQAYVTRTNWKTALEGWQDSYNKLSKARDIEVERNRANEDHLRRLIENEKTRSEGLQKQIAALSDDHNKFVNEVATQQKVLSQGDIQCVVLQANLDNTIKELDTVRKRNLDLENGKTQLVLDKEYALREKVKAENEAKLFRSNSDELQKKNEELVLQVNEYKLNGGMRNPLVDRPPPPVLSNLRGEVENVSSKGDLVTLSIGADAGLSKGTVLELSRIDNDGGHYLGTVKVYDLGYKTAIAEFIPKDPKVPFARLKPNELPKKGDLVKPVESVVSGRLGSR